MKESEEKAIVDFINFIIETGELSGKDNNFIHDEYIKYRDEKQRHGDSSKQS